MLQEATFLPFWYVSPLKPSKLTDRFLYGSFDKECTQDLEKHDVSIIFPTSCAQQMCSKCEAVDDLCINCKQCGKRTHLFWAEDPLGNFVDYILWSKRFVDKIYVISHNSRGYDAQFLLRKFLELRWTPQLIMDVTKILSMIVENLQFLDSLNFLPMSLRVCTNRLNSHARRVINHTF